MGAIYSILNKENGKIYVGQSVKPNKRLSQHRSQLRGEYHPNHHLQNAFNKYGEEAFEFNVLEYCDDDKLNDNEIWWINYFDSMNQSKGYNLQTGGDSNYSFPDEIKEKIKSNTPIKREKDHPMYGRKHSDESIQRMKESHRKNPSWLGRHHTEESKRKISEARKGMKFTEEHKRNISLNHADQSGENNGCWGTSVIEEYGGLDYLIECAENGKSQTKTAEEIGIARGTIYDYLKARGYKWTELAEGGDSRW